MKYCIEILNANTCKKLHLLTTHVVRYTCVIYSIERLTWPATFKEVDGSDPWVADWMTACPDWITSIRNI